MLLILSSGARSENFPNPAQEENVEGTRGAAEGAGAGGGVGGVLLPQMLSPASFSQKYLPYRQGMGTLNAYLGPDIRI
jgi:hypothetical protein